MDRRIARLLLLILLTAGAVWQTAVPANAQSVAPNDLDDYFQRLEAQQGFSGAVLIADENDILLHEGFGFADDEGTPMTRDTVLSLGPVSKQMTAAAILLLEAQGKLRVEDPISVHLPLATEDKRDITIHQLLTHSAGFLTDHFNDEYKPMSKEEASKIIFTTELEYEPGTRQFYSNTGYTILAAIVEAVSGQSYIEFLQDNFFEPLGMENTGFFNDDWQGVSVANGYWFSRNNGKPTEFSGPYWSIMGNDGILTTVEDLYLWWRALEENTILPPEQTAKMFTPHVPEGTGESSYYGYGWVVDESDLGPIYTHSGSGQGGNADISAFPESDLVMIILSNEVGGETALGFIPTAMRFPATEAQQQLSTNIAIDDYTNIPRSRALWPYFLGLLLLILLLIPFLMYFINWLRGYR